MDCTLGRFGGVGFSGWGGAGAGWGEVLIFVLVSQLPRGFVIGVRSITRASIRIACSRLFNYDQA